MNKGIYEREHVLLRLCKALGRNLIVAPDNEHHGFLAYIDGVEYKDNRDDIMLSGISGEADGTHEALNDLSEKVNGKIAVINATSKENRREYIILIEQHNW